MEEDLTKFTDKFTKVFSISTRVNMLWNCFEQKCIKSIDTFVLSKMTSSMVQPWHSSPLKKEEEDLQKSTCYQKTIGLTSLQEDSERSPASMSKSPWWLYQQHGKWASLQQQEALYLHQGYEAWQLPCCPTEERWHQLFGTHWPGRDLELAVC